MECYFQVDVSVSGSLISRHHFTAPWCFVAAAKLTKQRGAVFVGAVSPARGDATEFLPSFEGVSRSPGQTDERRKNNS